MPKASGRKQVAKIHKQVLTDERRMAKKVARREVGKAKRIVRRKGQWTVAAGAFGYHAGYDSKEGFYARKGHLIHQGVASQPVGTYQIPASSSYVFKPFYTTKPGPRGGLIVCGVQNIGQIASTAAATAGAFVIGGSRTTSFFLSPDDIGGPMALDARKYNFYRFKKVKLIIPMNASSTDTQNMAIAYLPDPASSTFATIDYTTMQQATDLFVGSRKQLNGPIVINITMLNKAQFKKYNTEIDTTDSMSIRACRQGVIFGIFDAVDSANLKYGDVVMEYELELYDRCPDYGFTLQVSDLPMLSRIQKMLIETVSEHKSRGDSDESVERKLPRWKSQLRQLDRYIRTHLPMYDDARYGAQVSIVGPSTLVGRPCIAEVTYTNGGTTVAGLSSGAMDSLQCVQAGAYNRLAEPIVGFALKDSSGNALHTSVPITAIGGSVSAQTGFDGDVKTSNMATANVVQNVTQVGVCTMATAKDEKGARIPPPSTTVAPVPGALILPEVDEKKLSANARLHLPLLRNLSAMPSDKRRVAMKDIVVHGYDVIRKQWPPIVAEYPGVLRMLAQHLVDMSGAEARRQDDSESSDEDTDTSDYVLVSSAKGPTKKISYGEFRLMVDETQYAEYQRLRSLARIAQRSFSIDPTDAGRKSASTKCQQEIVQLLRSWSIQPPPAAAPVAK